MSISGRLTPVVLGCITWSRFLLSLVFDNHIAKEKGIVCFRSVLSKAKSVNIFKDSR